MALSRKNWNYIIMASSVFMISVLSFLDDKTAQIPNDAVPLFDKQSTLQQLQLNGVWLANQDGKWQCQASVLNCQEWSQAWLNIKVSPLASKPSVSSNAITLVIAIKNTSEAQTWQYFPVEGLLQSSNLNWYLIPPSLRINLQPIVAIQTNSN